MHVGILLTNMHNVREWIFLNTPRVERTIIYISVSVIAVILKGHISLTQQTKNGSPGFLHAAFFHASSPQQKKHLVTAPFLRQLQSLQFLRSSGGELRVVQTDYLDKVKTLA